MSEWMKIIAYAFITLFLGVVLKELGFKGTRLVMILGTLSLLCVSITYIGEAMSIFPVAYADGEEYAVAMLKMVGVGYAFGICSDICRELGEGSLSGVVVLLGRVEILALSVPFIKRIIERSVELI